MWLKHKQIKTVDSVTDDGKVPPKKRTAVENIFSYLKEYCNYSGIHGFRYLSEGHRNSFEKLFWASAIAISTFGCAMMIAMTKTRMETTPIIVTLAENPTKLWHVPFPAVTICPDSVSRLTAFNFTKYIELASKDADFFQDFWKWVNESKIERGTRDSQTDFRLRFPENDNEFKSSALFQNAKQRNSLYKKLWALITLRPGLGVVHDYPSGNGTLALDENDMDFLVEVAPKMTTGRDFVKDFRNNAMFWKHHFMSLDHHFKHIWTELGLCFTFNMMDNVHVYADEVVNFNVFKRRGLDQNFPKSSNDWDPEKGYHRIFRRDTYPWRARPHVRQIGLKQLRIVTTQNLDDINKVWGKNTLNYWVAFHQPQDHPLLAHMGLIKLPYYKLVDIAIDIDLMTTSPELKNYGPYVRGCYYSYEKHLKYFKIYSEINCQIECITNLTLRECGCAAFFMPRFNGTKICGQDALSCARDAKLHAAGHEIDVASKRLYKSNASRFSTASMRTECDCLPTCLSISYEAEVRVTEDFRSPNSLYMIHFLPNSYEKTWAFSCVDIQMKKTSFFASRRSEYYGRLEFLANCGGLLGLFCGFSILSLIEIIYFLTIRLWTNTYRRLTSRLPPEGLVDAEDPARRLAFDILPPVDTPSLNTNFSTCVNEKSQKWKHGPGTLDRSQHLTDIFLQDYR